MSQRSKSTPTGRAEPYPVDRPGTDSDALIRYQAIFDAANDAIFLMQGDRFIDCNPMTLEVFGCTRDQILGHPPYRFSPSLQPDGRDSRDAALEWIQAAVDNGPQRFEWLHARFDGTPFHAEVSLNRVDLGNEVFLQAIVRDVTPRTLAEDQIRRSEARYRELFEKASDGIVVCSADLRVVDANPSFAAMTGYSIKELRQRKITHLYLDATPGDLQASLQTVLRGDVSRRDRRLRRKDGSAIDVEGRSKMLGDGTFLELYRDVTEARRQEEERQRLGRIETMGIIAGGIAHDFNNILTAALGYVELGRQHCEGIAQVESDLDNAIAAIERARKLTQQLLVFARGGEPVRRVLSLETLIRESVDFSLRGSNVACRYDLPEDLWPVMADEAQIGQVFHNIVLNANQAMHSGGEILVRGRNVDIVDEGTDGSGSGPFVSVVIADQGGGISRDFLQRIFDPYFTTKADGRGLGLPTAYRIVQRHGGRLSVDVEPGIGCSFTVLLPAAPGAVSESTIDPGTRRRGWERILVMDDEADILGLLRKVLGQAGYDVQCASDGADAIELCRLQADAGRAFDLAILDLTVRGGMGGAEALPLLRGVIPGLRVIVSSGYSDDPVMADSQEKGFDGSCAKPYRIDSLLAEIERVLDLPPRSPG